MNRQPLQQCRYFPCKCFGLGSGISCQVYNAIYQPSGEFRVAVSASPNPTNEVCAAKQINADHAATKYAQIEIDILKSLQHVNIVSLLDVVPFSDGRIALYMDRCDGNLDGLIKRPEHYWGLPGPLVLSLVSQYTDGFRYLFNRNVVHRDIKPLNILYNINPSPLASKYGRRDEYIFKLADFGVAKKTGGDQQGSDILKSLVGTPEFLCPEVLRGRYGPTADLWSAAVMFYYAIAGHLPFVGRDFHSKFSNYLILLASTRKYDDIAAFCGSSDLSQIEFASTLPQYCQLFGRLKVVFERLLRLMLSPALNKSLELNAVSSSPSDSLGVVNLNQAMLESSKKMFDDFFKYVDAITKHCWVHVFDMSTFSVSVAHINPDLFQKPDAELVEVVLTAVGKSINSKPLLVIGSSRGVEAFNGQVIFEGGLVGFRTRYLAGTLTDPRKTMLICGSQEGSMANPLRKTYDDLTKELFIRHELDFGRLPKATAQFFERVVYLFNAGIFPAICANRSYLQCRVESSRHLLQMANLSDMLAGSFVDQLNEVDRLSTVCQECDRKLVESLTVLSGCQYRAQALAQKCDVYAGITPASSGISCQHVSRSDHRDLVQLVVAATTTGRSELNKQRVKTVENFLKAADAILPEAVKVFYSLSRAVETLDTMESQLFDLCVQPNKSSSSGAGDVEQQKTIEPLPGPSQTAVDSLLQQPTDSDASSNIAASLSSIRAPQQVKQSLAVLLSSLNALQSAVVSQNGNNNAPR